MQRRRVPLRRRFGWRLYALPVLIAATVVALVHIASQPGTSADATGVPTDTVSRVHGQSLEGYGPGLSGYRPATTPAAVELSMPGETTTCLTNRYPQLVIVSVSQQHLWACRGHRQVATTAVTTGETDNGDQTPLGSWRVQAKQRDRYLVGPGYRDFVRYWVPFNGDFGFHDASWQTMPFGSQDYHTSGSHGCVHLPTSMMSWLYQWVQVGTVVTVDS